jgi:hypothetical protein
MTRFLRARDILQNLQDCRSDDSGEEGPEAESEQEYQPEIEFSDPSSSETEDELDAPTAAFAFFFTNVSLV